MKKLLFVAMLSILPFSTFTLVAQDDVPQKAEKTISDNDVKNLAQTELDSLLSYFKNFEHVRKMSGKIKVDTTQFFFNPAQVVNTVTTNPTIKKVHQELCKEEKFVNDFHYEQALIKSVKKDTTKKGDGWYIADANFLVRNVVKNVADSLLSDEKYSVVMQMSFKLDKKSELPKIKKLTVIKCDVCDLNYLASEKNAMVKLAESSITSWYANLDTELKVDKIEQEVNAVDVLPLTKNVNMSSVAVEGHMDYTTRTYTWKAEEQRVTVAVDPMNFIEKEEEYLYDLATVSASLRFTPQFTVVLTAEPYKVESFDVQYTDYTIDKPITEVEKAKRNELAGEFIGNYISSLEAYAAGDKATRESLRPEVEAMFADGAKIEVSYFPKGGNDRKIVREVSKYLTLLKDAVLEVVKIERTKTATNVESVEYRLTQSFAGKKYSDEVAKVVKMEYKDGRWVIIGITVDGPTKRH